jgi:hypothetical protein
MPDATHPLSSALLVFHAALEQTDGNCPPLPDMAALSLHATALCCQKLARAMSTNRPKEAEYPLNTALELREMLVQVTAYERADGPGIAEVYRETAAMLLNVADQLDPDGD